ncbi:unnamed protein product [Lactuca saligna]|uniref:RNase III domain-containing protein n=1 Tax=Lactuca saligna TaxID=75948 RepID=A0AA36E329_LACSI|nr:unnamed protein product [Lactuca saligna]
MILSQESPSRLSQVTQSNLKISSITKSSATRTKENLSPKVISVDFVSEIIFLESYNKKSVKESESSHVSPPSLAEVEEVMGYSFRNKELLKEAFTHGSYKADDCKSYERLEYLGEAVLNHLIAKLHYLSYPDMAPGELTRLRAANVDTEALARAALKYNLHKFLRHQKPLLQRQIQEFMEGIEQYPSHSHGMIDPPKVLADLLESLIGAIFIDTDSSMDSTWEAINYLQLHPSKFLENELIGRGKYKLKKVIAVNRAKDDAYNNLFLFEKKDGGNGG